MGPRLKYWVKPDIENRIHPGEIRALFNTRVEQIEPGQIRVRDTTGQQTIQPRKSSP